METRRTISVVSSKGISVEVTYWPGSKLWDIQTDDGLNGLQEIHFSPDQFEIFVDCLDRARRLRA